MQINSRFHGTFVIVYGVIGLPSSLG
jgi:hypothetical protein